MTAEGYVGLLLMFASAFAIGSRAGFRIAKKDDDPSAMRGFFTGMMLLYFLGMLLFQPDASSSSASEYIVGMIIFGALVIIGTGMLSTGFFWLFNKFVKWYGKTLPQ